MPFETPAGVSLAELPLFTITNGLFGVLQCKIGLPGMHTRT